ncbi:MAG: hypothetical protein QOG72_428 [Sphingomonadales bacterium]|nr:hypothetical protein [Sphingomonadales bacterium]
MTPPYPRPPARRFRVYALDPRSANSPETATINDTVVSLPWEADYEAPLEAGPTGEYLEVVDYDAPAQCFYAPLDPNHPDLLAQNGLPPSEGRPQFHQQMVYAVAMKTIRGFEWALGRKVLWARTGTGKELDEYIPRLRIYPHALAEANAYYSPAKTALLFGYFRDAAPVGEGLPGGWIFTCLSHDIIAHETAHAILHGMHRRSIEATGRDTLAFHEAFADIVALMQHFTMAEVVAHAIATTSGKLRMQSLLSDLAGQFGQATRVGRALRSGIDRAVDESTGRLAEPDPSLYQTVFEPHRRGSILVGAVFDAFLTIFERRTADLMRIATGRSTPTGAELSQDLVRRLAKEAAKSADHVLRMCVRGLDYLPVTDISFGEYLRAVITADADLVPDDSRCYRIILADAFRRRGIFQKGWLSMAPDSLVWEGPDSTLDLARRPVSDLLGRLDLMPRFKREEVARQERENCVTIHDWLHAQSLGDEKLAGEWEKLLGLRLRATPLRSIPDGRERGQPAFEVHSARIARRAGPEGQEVRQLLIELTQRRRAFDSPDDQRQADEGILPRERHEDFIFRGGATLVVDLTTATLRYAIRKNIADDDRLDQQRQSRLSRRRVGLAPTYFSQQNAKEPFAFVHRL